MKGLTKGGSYTFISQFSLHKRNGVHELQSSQQHFSKRSLWRIQIASFGGLLKERREGDCGSERRALGTGSKNNHEPSLPPTHSFCPDTTLASSVILGNSPGLSFLICQLGMTVICMIILSWGKSKMLLDVTLF